MAIARKNIDLEDGFLKGSPGATFAFEHASSRMIAYGGNEALRVLDLDDDDEDEYDEEEEDDEEGEDDDDDEGEEIDDEEEEEIEGDDPDQTRIPGSSLIFRNL